MPSLPPELRLVDDAGTPVPMGTHGRELEEGRGYWLRSDNGPCSVTLDGSLLPWTERGAAVRVAYAIGRARVDVRHRGRHWSLPLRIAPARHKLATAEWAALLEDLETWLPGLTSGAEGLKGGAVGTVGIARPLLAAALVPLLPALEKALTAVLAQPLTVAVDVQEERSLNTTRAADRETVAWLARHPQTAVWLQPEHYGALSGRPPSLPQNTTLDTRHHPANHHVAWLVGRVLRTLRETAEGLRKLQGNELTDGARWRAQRADALELAERRLERRWHRGPLAGLPRRAASDGALMVVLDHPAYGRFHRLARRVLSARFEGLQTGDAPVRPSFDLYELWCFLAVHTDLARRLGPAWTWRGLGFGRLLALDGTGGGARVVGKGPQGEVEISFNRTFPSMAAGPTADGRRSLSRERRPDVVVAWNIENNVGWAIFDAKYRTGDRSLAEALESAHIYRDSLRWDAHGGRCAGAWLLAPRRIVDGPCAEWWSPGFWATEGLGVIEARPGGGLDLPRALPPFVVPVR